MPHSHSRDASVSHRFRTEHGSYDGDDGGDDDDDDDGDDDDDDDGDDNSSTPTLCFHVCVCVSSSRSGHVTPSDVSCFLGGVSGVIAASLLLLLDASRGDRLHRRLRHGVRRLSIA